MVQARTIARANAVALACSAIDALGSRGAFELTRRNRGAISKLGVVSNFGLRFSNFRLRNDAG